MRRSSPPSVSSSMVKGGVREGLSIANSSTMISISPVGRLGFLLDLSLTVPLAWMTNSRPSFRAAVHREALSSILNTN